MKKIITMFFITIFSVALITGCSFKKDDKKEESKKEVNEKDKENENNSKKEVDKFKNISWIGKYMMYDVSDGEVFIELYLEADNPYLNIDVLKISYSYDNPNEDGFASINSYNFSFYLDNVNDDEITIDDEFLGLKGSITRTEDGLNFIIDHDEEGTHYFAEGSYSKYNDETEIRGYYVNGDKYIAISPLGDYTRVSYTDNDESFSLICSPGPIIKYDDYAWYFNIEKTDNGIKIESDNEDFKGEYVLEK